MKIAVLRANALGDFIFVLPALEALRNHYPTAEIIYLGCPWHIDILPHCQFIDRVEIVPVSTGVRLDSGEQPNKSKLENFFAKMKQEHFDIAFQLHGGGKFSNPFIKKLHARKTVGLQDKDAEPLDVSIPYIYYQNEYARYLEVVDAVGAISISLLPKLQVKDSIPPVENYVILHVGASDPRRRWPVNKFILVGEWLQKQGFKIILTGSHTESELTNQVESQLEVINTTGQLDLSNLLTYIHSAQIVISNDTGPYHLAVALDTKAVGIFWCGNSINAAPLLRSRHRQVLSWQTHCSLCGFDIATPGYPFTHVTTTCQHNISFVDAVSVESVIGEIKGLI